MVLVKVGWRGVDLGIKAGVTAGVNESNGWMEKTNLNSLSKEKMEVGGYHELCVHLFIRIVDRWMDGITACTVKNV